MTALSRPTHAEFERFFQLHAAVADAKPELELLKDKIKPWLEKNDNQSPIDLPYLAILRIQDRKVSDWKGACAKVLFRLFRSKPRVEKEMKDIEEGFEMKPVLQVCVEINHHYAAKERAS